jgi:hypothetical protein
VSFDGDLLTTDDVRRAVKPLRLIFWGGLLCIFDITFGQTTNGRGFRCDILNDAVGAFLIAWGVFALAEIRVDERYKQAMTFVKIMSVLAVLNAVRAHFVFNMPTLLSFLLTVYGLVSLAAIVVFCIAMRWFCEVAWLPEAARSWQTTTVLFVLIYAVPLGLFNLASCFAILTGKSFHINLGPFALLLLPVFAIPIVHLFVSTSRMAKSAESVKSESNFGVGTYDERQPRDW